jgi:hypothetical protein
MVKNIPSQRHFKAWVISVKAKGLRGVELRYLKTPLSITFTGK